RRHRGDPRLRPGPRRGGGTRPRPLPLRPVALDGGAGDPVRAVGAGDVRRRPDRAPARPAGARLAERPHDRLRRRDPQAGGQPQRGGAPPARPPAPGAATSGGGAARPRARRRGRRGAKGLKTPS
ncbi:hypothetical protein QU39_00245, partial [Staphylococcus aureus]